MNIRIKFEKYSRARFIGHLDLMRYFQKALRRANLPLEFSKGFHPHPIMSFANPISVGLSSAGEYFDVRLKNEIDLDKAKEDLNDVMMEGIRISEIISLPEKTKPSMSLVYKASYTVYFNDNNTIEKENLDNAIEKLLNQKEVIYEKQTKKSVVTKDIKPFIYELYTDFIEKDNSYELPYGLCIKMTVKSGSEDNITPMPIINMLFDILNKDINEYSFGIHRDCIYLKNNN